MNKEYFEDDIFNIPNINLEKIPVPFTFGQSLVNSNVPYNFITEFSGQLYIMNITKTWNS